MYWFFKLFDMCNAFHDNYYGNEVFDRMDDHLRGINSIHANLRLRLR